MFSTIYFALCSGLAQRATLPDYAAAVLDGAAERAYCAVDEVLDSAARKLSDADVARLVAAGDASLLLGYDEDAEDLYRRALNAENPAPVVHRGLGMLYEKLGRPSDAASEYEKYLELAPTAIDRERIKKRIETLRRT